MDAICRENRAKHEPNDDGVQAMISSQENPEAGLFSAPEACCGEKLQPFWSEDGRSISVCKRCGREFTDKTQVRYGGSPWIGVDLDGTLARDVGNVGWDKIGSPIQPMMTRIKKWLAKGQTVKIFTARASSPRQVTAIKQWLAKHGLPDLEVTNVKDLRMIQLWDDRCVQVTTNLGEPINENPESWRRRPTGTRGATSLGFFSRLRILLTL
jgi:hypothetical protein